MNNLCCLVMDDTMSVAEGGVVVKNFSQTLPLLASFCKRQAQMEGRERRRAGGGGEEGARSQSYNHIFLSR